MLILLSNCNHCPASDFSRRKKRAVHNEMARTIKRIQKGIEKVMHFHSYNVVKGVRNILKSGKEFSANFYHSMEKLVIDGLEDIDSRLNRQENDDVSDDQAEDDDETETNILTDYCFGEIYGPNYGIRTLLEFEEECDEGSTCSADIDGDSASEQNVDIGPTTGNVKRYFDHHITNKGKLLLDFFRESYRYRFLNNFTNLNELVLSG